MSVTRLVKDVPGRILRSQVFQARVTSAGTPPTGTMKFLPFGP